jgi:PKD repeat protein
MSMYSLGLRGSAMLALVALTTCTIPSDEGGSSAPPPSTAQPPLTALRIGSPTATVVAMAAGDIAGCTSGYRDEATAALIQKEPGALVFAVGDIAYPDGTVAEFGCYNASWGAFKSRTYPTPGNHEYHQPGAKPYWDYFNGVGVDSGRAGHRARGSYALDYGAWRVIVVNSQLNVPAQLTWLKAELAANPRQCTLAFWHRPFYSSGNGSDLSPSLKTLWDALLAAKAEIILGGSHHHYERFARQNSSGGATATGIRQFVVGTGGAGLGGAIPQKVNSEKLIVHTHGVLRLTLAPGKYSYQFQRIDGAILDSGETPCVGTQPPSATKIVLEVTGREDATTQYMTLDWTGASGPNVDVFRNGALLGTTPNDGHYTNSRASQGSVTYVYKVCETGTAVCSNEATVVFGGGGTQNKPPAANFSPSCDERDCSFTDLSTDSDGSVTGWSWAFGDGTSSTTRHPTHTYAADGSYEVTLVAKDDDGATNTAKKTVVVAPNSPPAANFTVSCDGFTCTFTDTSTDSDGSVTAWSWTFGDGASATTRNPTHTYEAEGSHEVTLVATDDDGATGSVTQTVAVTPAPPNTPPIADFSVSCTGLSCTFTDRSSDSDGSVTTWSWSFGDGGTSTGRNPTHTYAAAGTYDVTLSVTDDDGGRGSVSKPVSPSDPPPPGIVLTLSGRADPTTHYMTLDWTGAQGTSVDVYRNGAFRIATPNDGHYVNSRPFQGSATYTYKVCNTGTTVCSNEATVTVTN